jgi:hypothetical protein
LDRRLRRAGPVGLRDALPPLVLGCAGLRLVRAGLWGLLAGFACGVARKGSLRPPPARSALAVALLLRILFAVSAELGPVRGDGGVVVSVSCRATHRVSKDVQPSIRLVAGLGVEGDAHMGATVKHRSRVRVDPSQPNLRQVHLIHSELHDELRAAGFDVSPGQMGENVTTSGIDLLALPTGAVVRLGDQAVVEITGLRNPCVQLEGLQRGLMQAVLDRDAEGNVVRKCGVMGVVLEGGEVKPGDAIEVELPASPHVPLQKV